MFSVLHPRLWFLFFFCAVCLPMAISQKDSIYFSSHSEAEEIFRGVQFEVAFVLHNSGEGSGLQPPSFKGFKVVSGPNRAMKSSILGGKLTHEQEWRFTLESQQPGVFTIGPAYIKVGDEILESNPVKVIVKNEKMQVEAALGDSLNLEEAIMLKLEVDRSDVYIGERVTLDYVIYSATNIQSFKTVKDPEFVFFRVQESEEYDHENKKVVRNGRSYIKKILKRMSLYPLKEGCLTADSLKMEFEIEIKKESESSGNNKAGASLFSKRPSVRVQMISDSVRVCVKGLARGKALPVDCKSMQMQVGNIAQANKEGLGVFVMVNTEGDVKRLLPPGLGISGPRMKVRLVQEGEYFQDGKIIGERTFEYRLDQGDKVKLTPSMEYFDTQAGEVKTLSLPTREVKVLSSLKPVSPKRGKKEQQEKEVSSALVFVVDVSSSMLTQDLKPDRLNFTKKLLRAYVKNQIRHKAGLVLFAGESKVLCPLTRDHSLFGSIIDSLEVGSIKDGTGQGMGIVTALNMLREVSCSDKSIVLLTDGVNNTGYLHPLLAAYMAAQLQVSLFTVSIGRPGEALTPVGKRSDGSYIMGKAKSEVNDELLRKMSEATGGKYLRVEREEQLDLVLWTLNNLRSRPGSRPGKLTFHPAQLDLLLKGTITGEYP